jgi:multiple sugar transport system substrate-binding protein
MKRLRYLLIAVVCMSITLLGTSSIGAQDQVTVTMWHTYNEVGPETQMLTETLIPAFEAAHPNIKVEAVAYPYDGFRQALLTALAGGTGPDLARLDIIWSPEFADQGVLAALDDVMPDFQEYADKVFPGPLSTNAYDGHYYGLPLDTNTRVLVYGPAMLEAAGIDAVPATMDEVAAACAQVTALGAGNYLFSDGGTSGWNLLPWIWSFGGDIVNPEMTQATGYLNGEKSVAALEFLKARMDEGCFSDGFIGSGIDNWGSFFGGTIATMLEGPWLYPVAESDHPDFAVGGALMPAGDGGSVSVVGGENVVLFNTTQQQDAALEFLRFTQSEEYQQQMSTVGQLTVLNALVDTDYFTNHAYYPIFLEQLQTARARTPVPQWTSMEEVLSDAGQLILRGEASAQDALDAAAEEIDSILAQ